MQYKFWQKRLDKVVGFLGCVYDFRVLLVSKYIGVDQQVAQWKNRCLIIDIRQRGIMGTLFILCHVFGHLVQHSTTRKYDDMLAVVNSRPIPLVLTQEFKGCYFEYEKEAFQIGKGVMEQVFEVSENIDKLYQVFMYTDYEHFWNYLTTGIGFSYDEFHKLFEDNKSKMADIIEEPLKSIVPPSKILYSNNNYCCVV